MTPLPLDHSQVDLLFSALTPAEPSSQTRSLLFTAPEGWSGTSSVAWTFAQRAALAGHRVVYLDLATIAPFSERVLGLERQPWPEAQTGLEQVRIQVRANLSIVAARRADAPPEIAGDDLRAVARLIEFCSSDTDLIVCDAPAVTMGRHGGMLPTHAIAPLVDGIVLVVLAGGSSEQRVAGAAERLRAAGGEIVGTVLNERDMETPLAGLARRWRGAVERWPLIARLAGRSRFDRPPGLAGG